MNIKRHTPVQMIRKLHTAEQLLNLGLKVVDGCRSVEVLAPTYHPSAPCGAMAGHDQIRQTYAFQSLCITYGRQDPGYKLAMMPIGFKGEGSRPPPT